VANYIKERTRNAQFIVISLRNNMFELASRLVGVYKVNHMTKSVTIENVDYIVRAPPQVRLSCERGSDCRLWTCAERGADQERGQGQAGRVAVDFLSRRQERTATRKRNTRVCGSLDGVGVMGFWI
jgi:hypothetical protein